MKVCSACAAASQGLNKLSKTFGQIILNRQGCIEKGKNLSNPRIWTIGHPCFYFFCFTLNSPIILTLCITKMFIATLNVFLIVYLHKDCSDLLFNHLLHSVVWSDFCWCLGKGRASHLRTHAVHKHMSIFIWTLIFCCTAHSVCKITILTSWDQF